MKIQTKEQSKSNLMKDNINYHKQYSQTLLGMLQLIYIKFVWWIIIVRNKIRCEIISDQTK